MKSKEKSFDLSTCINALYKLSWHRCSIWHIHFVNFLIFLILVEYADSGFFVRAVDPFMVLVFFATCKGVLGDAVMFLYAFYVY